MQLIVLYWAFCKEIFKWKIYFNSILNNIQTFKIKLEGDMFLIAVFIFITVTLSVFYFAFGLCNKTQWIPEIHHTDSNMIKIIHVLDLSTVHLDIAVFVCVFIEGLCKTSELPSSLARIFMPWSMIVIFVYLRGLCFLLKT